MMENPKKRILVLEFHQESNTFNPIVLPTEMFLSGSRNVEGQAAYNVCKQQSCAVHGMIDAIEEQGGEVIPGICISAASGGRVNDGVLAHLFERTRWYVENSGHFDAICVSLHGATCTESEEDACGVYLEYIRSLVGDEMIVAASFDLHANITPKILKHADVVCGYQTYPHVDHYGTGYRAAKLCMEKLAGKTSYLAAAIVPMLTPPSGYTSLEEPFKGVIDSGKELIDDGTLLDFTVFNVQPWLDISVIGSTAVAIASDPETAKTKAEFLAQKLFEARDGCWPDLMSVDEIIDMAEANTSGKPVILVDASDSPNGGCVGDSVAAALRLMERGSKLRVGMFVKDPEAAAQAFEVGVGGTAQFTLGAKYTPGMPGPLVAEGTVRSLHDGIFRYEGPASKGAPVNMGKTAVVRFGTIDIIVCERPSGTGDPQIFRGFGIEPTLYDLMVVKANTSFRVPYSKFTDLFCFADTPGAGAANLKLFHWEHLPKGMYPFDLPSEQQIFEAAIWR